MKAAGEYPKGTKVQHVAHYQNDGTTRGVTPSRFVERAEEKADTWQKETVAAMDEFVDGNEQSLKTLGDKVADDIGVMCDRVDTGQLKASFESEVK